MDKLDAQQFFAGKEFTYAVLGSAGRGFVLIDLSRPNDKLVTEDEERDARAKGFSFCGTLAFLDNACVAAPEPDAESAAVCAAAMPEFAKRVAARLQSEEDGTDWTTWMTALFKLPDCRN